MRPYVYREGPVLGGVVPPRLHVRDVKGVGDRLDVVGRRVSLRAEDRNEALFHHVAHCKMDGALRHTLDSRPSSRGSSEAGTANRILTYFRGLEAVGRGDLVSRARQRRPDERAPVVVDHVAGVVEGGLDRPVVLGVEEGADPDVPRDRGLLPRDVRDAGQEEAEQEAQEPPRRLVRREGHGDLHSPSVASAHVAPRRFCIRQFL